jgi:hypothetical protein
MVFSSSGQCLPAQHRKAPFGVLSGLDGWFGMLCRGPRWAIANGLQTSTVWAGGVCKDAVVFGGGPP